MSGASYYKGLTIEYDTSSPHLWIDGQEVLVTKTGHSFEKVQNRRRWPAFWRGRETQTGEWFESSELPKTRKQSLQELAQLIVEHSVEFKRRERVRKNHLKILHSGVEQWNKWRKENPEIRPILYEAPLNHANLSNANFCNANLIGAQLQHADLSGANFHEANLGSATLLIEYASLEELLEGFKGIIDSAVEKHQELQTRKAKKLEVRSVRAFIKRNAE